MERKKFNILKFFSVLIITIVLFTTGFLLGNYFSEKKLTHIDELEQQLRTDSLSFETQYQLLNEKPCLILNQTIPITEQLYVLSDKLDYMENQLGEKNPEVQRLKEYYSLLELRHWSFVKNANKNCGGNKSFILYFYSNKGDCPKCADEGYVLTYVRRKNPDVKVYAFDININNPTLQLVKDIYMQNYTTPVLIINEKTYNGFKDAQEVESLINGKN